ncbi:MAG: minichromosome maintenance protein MCM [Thermoprotei archaeon]|nr:minichromosome maintenance protein MCM [Thermoprotei archaeon]
MAEVGSVAEAVYVERFKDFISNFRDESGRFKYVDRLRRMIEFGARSLIIEFSDLYKYDVELAYLLVDRPSEVLRDAGEAVKELVAQENLELVEKKKKFIVRVAGLYDTYKIRDIRSEHVGKLVQIEGIITRMHPLRSKMVKAIFRHEKCGSEFTWPQEEEEIGERIERPSICPVCGEGGGKFLLLKEKSEYIDWQRIVIQEKPEDVPGGQMPRSVEAHLTYDLVDSARPGDRVTIVGIVKLESTGEKSPLYEPYIEANSLRVSERVLEEVSISREDEEKIKELQRDPWIKERIVASIAPSIYGYWDLKEAIALLLFGGAPKTLPDGTRIRGDIHVLFVGDPGVAKSQLLQAATRIAPRSLYTTGKGSTAAGLTAAVLRDSKTGEYYLEAGALVLADGGVAVIDEIDKMEKDDRVAIHEAMEQQHISISKAGIVARLNARTSILAAGNPKLGVYDPQRSFIDNVNLPPTILSRFDLIFVVRDIIGVERDRQLAKHILEAHSMAERFKPEIDPELLKKYVIYARRYARPRLTPQAKDLIEEFFVETRSSALQYMSQGSQSPIPITARQLEAIIRLAEAHARMALRSEVTEEDAAAAIRLMSAFLQSVGLDIESGTIDVTTIMTGAGFTARRLMALILDTIKRQSEGGRCAKIDDIVSEVTSKHRVEKSKITEVIERMRQQGLIIEVRPQCYSPV